MLHHIESNLLNTHCQVIIHGVNCVGVMGRGVARQIRAKYPEVLEPYQKACRDTTFKPGLIQPIVCRDNRIIINCATQLEIARYKGDVVADTCSIFMCLNKVAKFVRDRGLGEVASPRLGSGLGGLKWQQDVLPIFERVSESNPDIDVFVYSIGRGRE